MKKNEAYSTLELPLDSSLDDVKKQYKLLAKKWHPDINKEPGAEEKFKKINEAHDAIKSNSFDDLHQGPFYRSQKVYENILVNTTISFKESVIGCKKDILFNRTIKCNNCNGAGNIPINNGCTNCGGKGRRTIQHGMTIMIQTCEKCMGISPHKNCEKCNSEGTLNVEASVNVTIPGGILNGNILRLSGMGHYCSSSGPFSMFGESYTDVHLVIKVENNSELSIKDNNVISHLKISLLEALKGCEKTVNTIDGQTNIKINSLSKNNDIVIIPKKGVNYNGNHNVILSVEYPQDVDNLINYLEN